MKTERAWLRIIVAGLVVTIGTVIAMIAGYVLAMFGGGGAASGLFVLFGLFVVFAGPTVAAALAHVFTPREQMDGHTRCGKCGYILKGLTEPRCSECGERI